MGQVIYRNSCNSPNDLMRQGELLSLILQMGRAGLRLLAEAVRGQTGRMWRSWRSGLVLSGALWTAVGKGLAEACRGEGIVSGYQHGGLGSPM